MGRKDPVRNRDNEPRNNEMLPNTLTVVGQGTPASFEVTFDGEFEPEEPGASDAMTIVSGTTAEGTIESGTQRFRFSGDVADVTIVNRGGLAPSSVVDPEIYVED